MRKIYKKKFKIGENSRSRFLERERESRTRRNDRGEIILEGHGTYDEDTILGKKMLKQSYKKHEKRDIGQDGLGE